MADYGDADGDGFLEYLDASGHGLANQGWKDSADSVRFADGRIADGPVALCEVQGYAYEAAISGAALLDAFDRPGGERVPELGRGAGRPVPGAVLVRRRDRPLPGAGPGRARSERVDALTSNIGHLLGTGLLDRGRGAGGGPAPGRSGARLRAGGCAPCPPRRRGYAPLSYHCGSVWPHDTAIAILGLHRAGLGGYADGLVEGLLRASVAFE